QGDTDFTLSDTLLKRGTGETEVLDGIEVVNLTGGPNPNTFILTGFTGTGSINGGDDPFNPRTDTIIMSANADFTVIDTLLNVSTNFGPIGLGVFMDPVTSLPRPSIEAVILTTGPAGHTLDVSGFSG